jgi:peptide/nickel transport system substrate-binding protein
MPQMEWDRLTSSGAIGNYDDSAEIRTTLGTSTPSLYVPIDPGTASTGALGVAQFINLEAQDLATYTSNPLWKVVDGPFKLAKFTNSGFFELVPNKSFSGSPKPKIGALEGEPFTSDSAEYDQIRSGALSIGYLPQQDLSERPSIEKTGYKYNAWYNFSIHYFAYNFTNPTTGPLVRQLYIRQALQYMVNQKEYIKDFDSGIGEVDNGPVPTAPTECGAGIKAGEPLALPLLYASGTLSLTNTVAAMQSTMSKVAGVQLATKALPSSTQFGLTFASCTTSTPCSDWTMSYIPWGYDPDYLPTGGEVFGCGAGSNAGDYCDSVNQANITATHTAPTSATETTALFKYQDYLARQLPVMWMPNGPSEYLVYKADLGGTYQRTISPLFAEYFRVK